MMTVHVLHAGDGYTYLTRQVASHDVAREGRDDLTDYYTAEGNTPGRWMGAGLVELGVSGEVSEAQMKALFGEGLHPDADRLGREKLEQYMRAGMGRAQALEQANQDVRLGRRFPRFVEKQSWNDVVATAYQAEAIALARPLTDEDRARVKNDVARSTFESALSRAPRDDAELKTWISARATPPKQPVAGFDLVFTPVKSVSVLWALGDVDTRRQIEAAHTASVGKALDYVQTHAAKTRVGAGGLAQLDTKGLVIAAFDHRDSRTGDPNLHTHAAVSNKVQGEDGKWRSIDARVMFALGVSASETYNTAIEDEISRRLGVRFASRSQAEVGKREVREIAGIDVRLNGRFSSRRSVIEQRFRDKMTTYRADHGHEAPKNVQRRLAQEATLESRPDKDDLRTLAAQRADWLAIARDVLGVKTDAQVEASVLGAVREAATVSSPVGVLDPTRLRVHDVLENDVYGFVGLISDYRRPEVAPVHSHADGTALPAPTSAQIAEVVLRSVQEENSTWTRWHLQAETERRLRRLADVTGPLSNGERSQRVQAITTLARAASIELTAPATETARPQQLIRADGESIYTVHGALRYSSTEILDAEDRLVRAARTTARAPISERAFEAALGLAAAESGRPIDVRQVALARSFATDKVLLQVGIGPAGTGKTTSMKLLVDAATMSGRRVIGLAPSAAAAAVLSGELGVKADTIHKLMHDHVNANPKAMQVQDGDIILVDEAGMAGTMRLDWLTKLAADNGAVVRLLGDPQQLAAVESGGALRLIEQEVGAVRLREVYRFRDPAEAAATLQVRDGKPEAVAFYTGAGRVAGGALDPMVDAIYTAWHADTQQGVSSLMVAARNDVVVQLSSRARVDRIAEGAVDDTRSLDLHDGNAASPGDHIVTRKNERTLQLHHGQDFVKNGDLWSVRDVHDDGSLTVQHRGHNGVVTLPADYAARHVELSYAATIHRVQGMTVDTSHTLVDSHTTRENLYVAGTRGRESNRFYTVTDPTVDVDGHHPPEEPRTPEQVLYAALAAVGAERSATETLRDELAQAQSLARLIPQYDDAFTRHANTVFDLRQIVTDIASPALATAILDDTAWPHLARAVAVQAAGHDPASVLRSAIDDRELTTAESPAKVLAWRITGKGGYLELVAANAARGEGLPSWVSSPPAQTTTAAGEDVSELTTWLRQRGELISTRIDSLVDVAAVEQPAWWRALGPEPLEEQRAREHAGVARDVAAWRDQHGVSAEHGLGARPSTEGPDRRAYDALQQRVRSIAAQATSPSSPEPGGQAARVAQRQVTGQSYDTDSRPEQRREGPRL